MPGRRAFLGAALLTLAVTAVACCPVSTPPPTAFVVQKLLALGDGTARAELADGRTVVLTGLDPRVTAPVYVTGTLQPDGRVAVRSAQPIDGAPTSGSGPG